MSNTVCSSYWVLDEDGNYDFVDHWNELTPEEEDEMFREMADEDIDAMFDYFDRLNQNKS